jgi:hypothetical protein
LIEVFVDAGDDRSQAQTDPERPPADIETAIKRIHGMAPYYKGAAREASVTGKQLVTSVGAAALI